MSIIAHIQLKYNIIQQKNLRNLTKKHRIPAVSRVLFSFKVSKTRHIYKI